MRPDSRFLNDLSQRAEADFKKYAIRSKVDNAWMSVRVLCDARATMSPGVPAGRACVKNAQRMVGRLAFGGGLYACLGVVAGCIPVAGGMISDGLRYTARANFTISGVMYAIDWKWQEAFCDRHACNGVVHMNSKQYAGAHAERIINNAEAHVGSTKSMLVTRELSDFALLACR